MNLLANIGKMPLGKLGALLLGLLALPAVAGAQGDTASVRFGLPTVIQTSAQDAPRPSLPPAAPRRPTQFPPMVNPANYAQFPPPNQPAFPAQTPAPPVFPPGVYNLRPQGMPVDPRIQPGVAPVPEPNFEPVIDEGTSVWVRAEFVFWFIKGSRLPPLVTTSPADTPLATAGVIGTPGTDVLLGDERVNGAFRPGGRFGVGIWFDDEASFGLEAGVMLIGGQTSSFSASSDGSRILARPFTDATTGAESAQVVSFPGLAGGGISAQSYSDPMIIADLVLRCNLTSTCDHRIDFVFGYRYLYFAESLQIQEDFTSLDPLTLGTNFSVADRFATRNDFHGALLGLDSTWALTDSLAVQIFGKLAVGNLRREVDISGGTVITAPGAAPITSAGGLLALSSNSGNFVNNHFVLFPEIGVTAGWQVTERLRLTAGYSLLWLTDMVRPGDQIDRTVNTSLLPPAALSGLVHPTFTLRESDFWVQGVRVGLELRF